MDKQTGSIEELIQELKDKLKTANEFHIDIEKGVHRRYDDFGRIVHISHESRETYINKFNHNDQYENKLI